MIVAESIRRSRHAPTADLRAALAHSYLNRQPAKCGNHFSARGAKPVIRHAQHFQHRNLGSTRPRRLRADRSLRSLRGSTRISLPQRSARKKGSRLIAATSFAFPRDHAGLRPAEQLVSAEADQVRRRGGSFPRAWVRVRGLRPSSVSIAAPLPRSSANGTRFLRASAAISSVGGDSTKPPMKKLLRCTFRISAVLRPMARA